MPFPVVNSNLLVIKKGCKIEALDKRHKKRAPIGALLCFVFLSNYGVTDKVNHIYFTSSPDASSVAYLIPTLALTIYYNFICYVLYKSKKNKFILKKAIKVFSYSILYLFLVFVFFLVDNLI